MPDRSASRREFLGSAAVGAVASVGAQVEAAEPPAPAPPPAAIRNVGVVGIGGRGSGHVRTLSRFEKSVRIVAVCDIIPERVDKAAGEYGCPAFYSVQEMLSSGIQIDAASMCTAGVENGGDHYKPTMELLSASIPVLGEKPISNRVSEAKQMVALAKRRGLRYGIDLNHRFTPAALRAKEWIDGGRLGEINIINMTMWINNLFHYTNSNP